MRVVIHTTHLAPIGGAENYMMRLAMAIEAVADLAVTANWPEDFLKFSGFGKKFKVYDGLYRPDVFIHCSHFSAFPPIGKLNYAVSLFPKKELKPVGYDGVIAICEYSAFWTQRYWDIESFVLHPAIDASLYVSGAKRKKIVSVGHFFEESDGHSKNQHILVEAFSGLPEYEFVLLGNAAGDDETYLRKVRKLAQGKNVRIETNKTSDFIKAELSSSTHLWHGNGYQRTDPGQTEHFGIIVLEALASGVVPIVHKSGGAPEIAGITWDTPSDLPRLTLENQFVPELDEKYTIPHFKRKVEQWAKDQSVLIEKMPKQSSGFLTSISAP
jgi:glycosyltransferase involved in cell wall biosynthesis